MSVMDRSTLAASPLADLHALASELGLDSFRRLRKAELIDALLARQGLDDADAGDVEPAKDGDPAARDPEAPERVGDEGSDRPETSARRSRPRRGRGRGARERPRAGDGGAEEPAARRGGPAGEERVAEGIVELLGNGSAFLRVNAPDPSDQDVYVSAAQVRRCELVSGDRVTGPVRAPRRSERYPSLVRVDTINDAPADAVTEGTHYEDLPATFPTERIALGSEDPTLKAIEWLTPLGKGSRAVIVGGFGAGKTEALRRLAAALAEQGGLAVAVILVGVRPEEIPEWNSGPATPTVALSLAASAEAQAQALERGVETARRVAARGEDAVLLIDGLDGVHPPVARKALAGARNLLDGGSLTVIATATRPFGGETTVIALDAQLTSTGRLPALDLAGSGSLRPELLVGAAGAQAIAQARAEALG